MGQKEEGHQHDDHVFLIRDHNDQEELILYLVLRVSHAFGFCVVLPDFLWFLYTFEKVGSAFSVFSQPL